MAYTPPEGRRAVRYALLRTGQRPRGGTLITHAGTDDRVAALVYIAALAPDGDETSQSQQAKFPTTDVFSHIEVADGRIWLRPDGVAAFAGDLPEVEQKVVWATQAVPVPDLFTQKAGRRRLEVEAELVHRGRQGPHLFIPSWNASWQSAWGPPPSRSTAATSPCSPNPASYSTRSARPPAPFKKTEDSVKHAGGLQLQLRDRFRIQFGETVASWSLFLIHGAVMSLIGRAP